MAAGAHARIVARHLTVVSLAGLLAGGAWITALDGAVAPVFWLLPPLTILSALGALALSVRARATGLFAASSMLFVLALLGTYLAILSWSLSEFTF
ncbi:MAG TPA: hypothetical protein VJ689_00030 [Gaiellaceae bacterium]|nr:hypothetical protein [Gaiellaceae bacterium]